MFWDWVILILAMLVAIFLGLAELFLLPGITLAGLAGLLFAGVGLYYAYAMSLVIGNITLVVSVALFLIGIVVFMRSRSLNRMALHTDVDSRLESSKDLGIQVGDEGMTLSRLAPIGKARMGSQTVEARSDAGFIDEDTPVVVVRVTGYNVVVRPKKTEIK